MEGRRDLSVWFLFLVVVSKSLVGEAFSDNEDKSSAAAADHPSSSGDGEVVRSGVLTGNPIFEEEEEKEETVNGGRVELLSSNDNNTTAAQHSTQSQEAEEDELKAQMTPSTQETVAKEDEGKRNGHDSSDNTRPDDQIHRSDGDSVADPSPKVINWDENSEQRQPPNQERHSYENMDSETPEKIGGGGGGKSQINERGSVANLASSSSSSSSVVPLSSVWTLLFASTVLLIAMNDSESINEQQSDQDVCPMSQCKWREMNDRESVTCSTICIHTNTCTAFCQLIIS